MIAHQFKFITYWYLCLLLLIFSCDYSTEESKQYKHSLDKINSLVVKDTALAFSSLCIKEISIENNDYILFHKKDLMVFYDIAKQKITKEVKLPQQYIKPNLFGSIFINVDSIYIIPFMVNKISSMILIDTSGLIKSTIEIKERNMGDFSFLSCLFCNDRPIIYYDFQKMILHNQSKENANTLDYYDKKHLFFFTLNLVTKEYKFVTGEYPKVYQGNFWNVDYFIVPHIKDKNKIIISFASSPNLLLRDINNNDYSEEIELHSKYLEKVIPLDSWQDWEAKEKYYITQAYFHQIIYDKYRDVYYRFVFHQSAYADSIKLQKRSIFEKPFSIIILDSNLKKLGETIFPEQKYINSIFFIGRKGLYILKKSSFEQQSLSKGEYEFDIFDIKTTEP
jgi:hypothetical protein